MKIKIIILFNICLFAIISCTDSSQSSVQSQPEVQKATVSDNGLNISFPKNSPGLKLISVEGAKYGRAVVSVNSPARVVAAISNSVSSSDKIILFDSPDMTTLYSQYKQTKTNIELYTKNLARVREMFANQGVTMKDVNEAENDLNLAKTTLTEMEGRLRSAGYNPIELENAGGATVWLISDVPEGLIHEVQNGEQVHIKFNAFQGLVLKGTVRSIGDVVDPVTRTIKVRVEMENYQGKLIPGMYATVDFGDPRNSVVVLPLAGVVTVDGKNYVFVENNPGEFIRREVMVENSTSDSIIIASGIKTGERVATNGAMLLKGLSFGY